MRARRLVALLPLVAAMTSCGPDDDRPTPTRRAAWSGPPGATLGTGVVRVHLRLDDFALSVTRGDRALLTTLPRDVLVPGDDPGAYTALGATHHETTFGTSLVEGWDHVTGQDDRWLRGLRVSRAELGVEHAVLDLFDPFEASGATTLHLEIGVEGDEVRLDASIIATPSSGAAEGDLARTTPSAARPLNQMGMAFTLPKDEHFYGLGERFVTMDHRGRRYECWTEEGGIAVGESAKPGPANPSPNGPGMTHVPVPFYVSSKGHGVWLATTYRTGFAFGSDDERAFRVYAEEPALHVRVLAHDDPKETIAHYTRLTGRARLPAPWVFGPRRRTDYGAMVDGVPEIEVLRNRKVPTTAADDATHFLPNASHVGREAELADWTRRLHALGYKAIGYYNAYVSVTKPEAASLVAHARAHDLFVKLDDGTEFDTFMVSGGGQKVATLDFTKPEAVTWYGSLLQQSLDLGYDGFMLDFGEYLPQRAVLGNGMTGWEAHNAFPVLYQRVTTEYMRRARGDDWMYFARSGGAGTQAYAPIVWSGDPAASFDDAKGLPAQVRAGVSAGLSGIPFWGSDISGYACNVDPPADKEVYLRWAEFGALSSDMHEENACAAAPPGAPPKWTLWGDAETTDVYGRYARLHTRLFPYLYAAAQEAVDTGLPVLRHPLLMAPTEPGALGVELEYFFGPSLYVAPVVRRGQRSREAWLPAGTWFDWWTLAPVSGGTKVTRDAPLELLPMWLRSGGVVAMLDPSIETLAEATRPEVVTLDKVAGVLDVRAGIDPAAQRGGSRLVDGTLLSVQLGKGEVVLPKEVTLAATEGELATCSGCGRIDPLPGGAMRVRVTTAETTDSVLSCGPLLLRAWRMPRPTRLRWDVAVVPSR